MPIFAVVFPYTTGDQSTKFEDFIDAHPDEVIELEADKVYLFSNPITISNKVVIKGTDQGSVLKLNKSQTSGYFITCGHPEIVFKNLTINGNMKVNKSIVNINDMDDITFNNVLIKNSGHTAIGAWNGQACHGLTVNGCTFSNIHEMCIKIINRDTDKYGSMITKLRGPVIVKNCTFNTGCSKIVEADCGNDDFVIDDESDPRWVIEDRDGGRRYEYTTDLAGSIVEDNHFKTYKSWALGLIQAGNIKFRNNTIEGPSSSATSNNSVVHMEQLCNKVEISGNTMEMNSGIGNPIFISMAAKEGRQRLSEEPRIIAVVGRGGFTGNSGNNTVRGSDNCPAGTNTLTCKKTIHEFGPRDIYIYDNTFIASSQIKSVIQFTDGENIKIGLTKAGISSPNDYAGLSGIDISKAKIFINKGDQGSCDVEINEPQLSMDSISDFDIASDAQLGGVASCITINGSNTRLISSSDIVEEIETVIFSPNPVNHSFTVIPLSEKDYTIKVYSIAGVLMRYYSGRGKAIYTIDELKSGLYIFEYKSSKEINAIRKRIIVR